MSKPRIIILLHYLELGGAEMSLIGLLGALDPGRVDVDLFIYSHRGPLMRFIPKWVNLLPEIPAYAAIESPLTQAIRKGHLMVAAGRLAARMRHRQWRRRHPAEGDDGAIMQYVGNCVTPWLPRISPGVSYDLAISFLTPHNICRDKVDAKRKVAWIHTDYSTVSVNTAIEEKVWGAFDHIASISPEVTRSFLEAFPSLSGKIVEIENILSPNFVRSRAAEDADIPWRDNASGVNLLSVGRFCTAKNYDNVPDIARRLVQDHGISGLRWYIIGYGGDEALIRDKIAQAGMEEHVLLLGKRTNPYPYIAACDIYAQPSRYEGKSVTVREAQMLCKPVAVTAYPTAPSQVRDGKDGVIVPMDNAGCARGLAALIADTGLRGSMAAYLQAHDYGNESETEKIYSLLK